jgi:hypothetical protein
MDTDLNVQVREPHKFMSRSENPTSSRLLQALAMQVRTLESQVPLVPHWAGKDNWPADAALCLFDPVDAHFAIDNACFLNLFNLSFPLPQIASW